MSEEGIDTQIKEDCEKRSPDDNLAPKCCEMMEPLLNGVGDAALLMAADGYMEVPVYMVGKSIGRLLYVLARIKRGSYFMPILIQKIYLRARSLFFVRLTKSVVL